MIHLKETYVFFSRGTTGALERYLRMPKTDKQTNKKPHNKTMHCKVAVEACACVRPRFKSRLTTSLACDFGKLISGPQFHHQENEDSDSVAVCLASLHERGECWWVLLMFFPTFKSL